MAPKLIYSIIVGVVLFAALALRIWDPAPVAKIRYLVFDSYQQLSPRTYKPELPVRIIDIDEESLKRIGQWPWPRTVMSNIVQKLKAGGAAAIGLDLIFSERDRLSPEQLARNWPNTEKFNNLREEIADLPSHDVQFANSIKSAPVVLGFISVDKKIDRIPAIKFGLAFAGDDPKLFVPRYKGASSSLPVLQENASGSGTLNWIPEHDQIIRRVPLLAQISDQVYPSLSAETLRIAQQASTYVIKSSGASGEQSFGQQTGINTIKIGAISVPTDANGQLWLKFTKSEPRRFIPAWKLLADKVPVEEIEGRIILVGTSAAGLFDLRTTPLDEAVPGVEVHAQAIEQMMEGVYLRRPDFALGAEIVYLTILGLLISALVFVLGATWSALVGASLVVIVIFASWQAYQTFGWLVDPIYPTISVIAIYLAGTLYVFLRTEAERNQVRSAFSRYMAPTLVEELASHPDKLRLGGESRDLTLMFCDVRGFTSISEGMNAEILTSFLNSLLTPLSNAILETRGTIDKYMGDAIMAFWNAPLDDPEHETNACRSALAMMAAIYNLNTKWKKNARLTGKNYKPVRIGIGINTGECCVGNLGSEQRFDYSVIGDNVNIASRLEGLTKTYGANIIIGESTQRKLSGFATIQLDLVAVKGRSKAIPIFWLIGDETIASSPEFIEYCDIHNQMLEAYKNRQWDEAEALIGKCRKLGGNQFEVLYKHFSGRINSFRMSPPPDDWDGSVISVSK